MGVLTSHIAWRSGVFMRFEVRLDDSWIPITIVRRTAEIAHRLGLRYVPEVLMIPVRVPPMVWALSRPLGLLLPDALWSQLTPAQQETILAHELAHLRRRDHWVRWLEAVTLGLYWWNPIAWWARRQIERAEEQCCDAWGVWVLPDFVESYAEALVATTAFLSSSRPLRPLGATGAGAAGIDRIAELRRRLSMILNDSGIGGIARPASRVALVAAAIILWLLPGWAPAELNASPDDLAARTRRSAAAVPASLEDAAAQPHLVAQDESGLPMTVDIASPTVANVAESYEFLGRVESARPVEIRVQVSGTLTKIGDSAGSSVEKGDFLFEVDPRPYEVEVRKAKAEVERCEAQLRLRTLNSAQTENLRKSNVVSEREVDLVAGQKDEAEAVLTVAKAALEIARLKLEATRVTAPIRGRLSRPRLTVGELVSADRTLLATIDPEVPLVVGFDIDQATVLKLLRERAKVLSSPPKSGLALLVGIPIEVGLPDEAGYPRSGRIESTDAGLTPETGTLHCRAAISNADGILLPGLSVRLRMSIGEPIRAQPSSKGAVRSEPGLIREASGEPATPPTAP